MTRTVLGLNNSGKWTFISYALTLAVAVGWAFAATAKTTTWKGGASGLWSEAANWDNGAPGAGDKAVFTKAVSLESETVTLGDGTLTIDSAVTITSSAVFAGTGAITKTGGGGLTFNARQTFTGKLTMQGGELNIAVDDALRASSADFYGSASLRSGGTSYVLNVPVNIFDCTTSPFSAGSTSWTYNELVSANCDFTVSTFTGNVSFRKGISAPGHTVTLDYNDSNNKSATLYGTINASVRKTRNGPLTVDSACVIAGGLSIEEGTQSCGKVMLTNSGNLLPTAVVKLNPGAVLELGASITVSELWIDGVRQEDDSYSAGHPSGRFSGSGSLTVSWVDPTRKTWIGGASGTFSEAANWDNGAPVGGDTAVINSQVALSSETFDFGSGGIVFDLNNETTCNVDFTGAGMLTVAGRGDSKVLIQQVDSSHTGGTRIRRGQLKKGSGCSWIGTQPVTICRYGDEIVRLDLGGGTLNNGIVIEESMPAAAWPIWCSNPATIKGDISAQGDFGIAAGFGQLTVDGGVSAPGYIVTARAHAGKIVFNSTVEAGLVKTGTHDVVVNSACSGSENALKVVQGALELGANASWAGRDVSVDGGVEGTAKLVLKGAENLSGATALKLLNGGVLQVDVVAAVAELWIGTERQPDGVYSATDLPDSLAGAGRLFVGQQAKIWVGGTSGLFSEATNWSGGTVPAVGETAVFTKEVTLESETVTLGEGTLTINNSATLTCNLVFAGVGALRKCGAGSVDFAAAQTYSGGTTVADGMLLLKNDSKPLGDGAITISGSGSIRPRPYWTNVGEAIYIADVGTQSVISDNGPGALTGTITADCDFCIDTVYQAFGVNGNVSAHGHTMTVDVASGNERKVTLRGEIDASVRKTGTGDLFLSDACNIMENLTVEGGKVTLQGAANLCPTASVRISVGAKLVLDETLAVAELWVGDVKLPVGKVYDASNLGDSLEGSGKLAVGFDLTQKKWVGGTSGTFSDAANWDPPFAPVSGDTLTVGHGVTFDAEEFALGEGSLTFYLLGTVNSNVKFTGLGAVRVTASAPTGILCACVDSEHTGGTFVPSGSLMVKGCERFGSQNISVSGAGRVNLAKAGGTFANDIDIAEDYADPNASAIRNSQAGKVTGAVTASADFAVVAAWNNLTFDGPVSAPGHTIVASGQNGEGLNGKVIFNGPVDASLVKTNVRDVVIAAVCPGAANALMVKQGTLQLTTSGHWSGKDVTVDGGTDGTARLALSGVDNLSAAASVKLLNGGQMQVDVVAAVAELWIGTERQPDGVYSAADLPDSLTGAGRLFVGRRAKIWVGGASGLFSEAINWSDGQSPVPGDVLVCTNAVTYEAETIVVGGVGLTLVNTAKVVCKARLEGSGDFLKLGSGDFELGTGGDDCAWDGFSGALRVIGGKFYVKNKSLATLGRGVLEVDAASGFVQFNAYSGRIDNSVIRVIGASDSSHVVLANGNPVNIYSEIVSDTDFALQSYWGAFNLRENVSAPGHTVTISTSAAAESDTPRVNIYKALNASLVKIGAGTLTMYGRSSGDDHSLTVLSGTNVFDAAASWEGTNVIVSGESSFLGISSAGNFSEQVVIHGEQGGKVSISEGVKVRIAGAFVDGEPVAPGLYTATTLPALLAGAGSLAVGDYGGMLPEDIVIDANDYATKLPLIDTNTVVDVASVGRISFVNWTESFVGRRFVLAKGTSFNLPSDFFGWRMEPADGGHSLAFSVENGQLVVEVRETTPVYPAGNGEVRVGSLDERVIVGLFKADWSGYSGSGFTYEDGAGLFTINKGGTHHLDARVSVTQVDDKTARFTYRFVPQVDVPAHKGLYAEFKLQAADFAGAKVKLYENPFSSSKNLPGDYTPDWEYSKGEVKNITVWDKSGNKRLYIDNLKADGSSAEWNVLLRDSRKSSETGSFSMRITFTSGAMTAGSVHEFSFELETSSGCRAMPGKQDVVAVGADYASMGTPFGWIKEGSVLDFSKQRATEAPAGLHGRVVRRGAHFEFADRPGVPQRFYGVNICRDTAMPDKTYAERFAVNMARVGYNAVRVQGYDDMIAAAADDSRSTLDDVAMDRFDFLMAKCIENGIYLTTDLQIGRSPTYRSCGIDRDGVMSRADYMILLPVSDSVWQNFAAFVQAFLTHVNPYTGRSLAEEPALIGLSIANEGSIMSFPPQTLLSIAEWRSAWEAWLGQKKALEPSIYGAMTADPPASISDGQKGLAYVLFRNDMEVAFVNRVRTFLSGIGCAAPITDMNNAWANGSPSMTTGSVWGGSSAAADALVRASALDYVDQHVYWDHPSFLETSWRAPWAQTAKNPLSIDILGGFTGHEMLRLLDRPFTISEYNYCAPQAYRSISGLLMGAMAALQDWDGIWRFDWSTGENGVTTPETGSLQIFDTAFDPINRAAEQALVPLFLRGDLATLSKTRGVPLSPSAYATPNDDYLLAKPTYYDAGWYAKLGMVATESWPASDAFASDLAGAVGLSKDAVMQKLGISRTADGKMPVAGDGQVVFDAAAGTLSVTADRTSGGFAPFGRIAAGRLTAQIAGGQAAVWVTTLDGREIGSSRRMLFAHLTDVQNSRTTYASIDHDILVSNGTLPLLMRKGLADVALQLEKDDGLCRAWAVAPDGSRRRRLVTNVDAQGVLTFTADVAAEANEVSYLYEIERVSKDGDAYVVEGENGTTRPIEIDVADAVSWPITVKLAGEAPEIGARVPVLTVPTSVRTLSGDDVRDASACAIGTAHVIVIESTDGMQTVFLETVDSTKMTWVGGESGLFSASANWSGRRAPASGDLLLVTNVVTWTAEDSAFDIGTAGLTISNTAAIACGVVFDGVGAIIKQGKGKLTFNGVQQAFSGGLTIAAGRVVSADADNPFGSGDIVITGEGAMEFHPWYRTMTNAIHIIDVGTQAVIIGNGPGSLTGPIDANCDFKIQVVYMRLNVSGDVSAQGRTVAAQVPVGDQWALTFGGQVDASMNVVGGTVTLNGSARCIGTDISVTGESSVLMAKHNDNLADTAFLRLFDGAMLNLDEGVLLNVGRFVVGTDEKPPRRYTAVTLPEAISGEGCLRVGKGGLILIVY